MNNKKKNILSCIIASAVFIVLIVFCLVFTGILRKNDNKKTAQVLETSSLETTTNEVISYEDETSTTVDNSETWYIKDNVTSYAPDAGDEITVSSEQADSNVSYTQYIFLGDSRYKAMAFCAGVKDVFVAENGMGYTYLVEKLDAVKSICNSTTALIIGLGVNDCGYRSAEYIAEINNMANSMDCQIYYMSVNPVDEAMEAAQADPYTVTNAMVDSFNADMKAGLSSKVIYIDSNSYLKQNGFTTKDGLHYVDSTYQVIYNYLKSVVG